MRTVTLSRDELLEGAVVGVARRVAALSRLAAQTVPGIDEDGKGWLRDVEGALAELAFARMLGVPWVPAGAASAGDVAGIQVRSATQRDAHLVVRERDRDEDLFVLVVGVAPTYRLAGFLRGAEAKRPEFRHDPGGRGFPCWWVPQAALRPHSTNGGGA